ncbi:glycerophosphodiester phosphodiesterase [Hydrogenophaga pseudoflava]|uniref:glycerophosphodiester phosphodiesterase n=1 Tax=Hydrogenophaga pseudoflava TaxID=47421 RepID=UPI0027E4E1DA|nr:glycerophosphodiester phosphodiesterase [Hydrogenophaga pseudoflava]MDQ7743409.1 glycerophosphodiester phosphodiesterase [Hydrogenophaga pseudoflava]
MNHSPTPWPYPRWIAHRGAGQLAPENTLAAFRLGAQHGYRMAECDAKLSADGVVFLLHDDTLDRTTDGQGLAGDHAWAELSLRDAGSWHSRQYAGERLPTLEGVARFCRANACLLNIEIKPTPGLEEETGRVVAREAARLWEGAPVPPLLTSFQPEALAGAQAAVAPLPRGLLLETLWDGWLDVARQLGCVAVVCDQVLWDVEVMAAVHGSGMRALAYTVNEPVSAERLWALGIDGLITDRVDLFAPD